MVHPTQIDQGSRDTIDPADLRVSARTAALRPWMYAWLAMLPVALVRAGTLAESDTFWEIRTGLVTIANRAIPTADPFSWTAQGHPWVLNSWGFDVFLAILYRIAGLPGVALGAAMLVMAVSGLVLLLARRLGAAPIVAGVLLLLSAPLLIAYLSARPQLVDYIAVLALMGVVTSRSGPASSAFQVGGLCILWVNLHAGVVVALAILGCHLLLNLVKPTSDRQSRRALSMFAAASLGTLVNPYGVGLIWHTFTVKNSSTAYVLEWQHIQLTSPLQVLTLLVGAAGLLVAIRRRNVEFMAALGVGVGGAICAIRVLPVVLLLALPMIAMELSHPTVVSYLRSRRHVWNLGLAVTVVMACVSLTHLGRPEPETYPSPRLVNAIPDACRVFNSYLLGGYLILQRPDVAVSLDSRNDLYGERRLEEDQATLNGKGDLDARLVGADCVVVPPQSGLAGRLDENRQWTLRASEGAAALYVRRRPFA